MVLTYLQNNTDQDVVLPWGQWNYTVPANGKLMSPPASVSTAIRERYPFIELMVEEEPVAEAVEEPTVEESVEAVDITGKVQKKRGRPKKGEDILKQLDQ